MKKLLSNRKFLVVLSMLLLVFLTGCQRNTDAQGNIIAEKIIYLSTPWKAMLDESILTAVLVYPLAQCINFIGTKLNSAVLGVVITTLLYNIITLGLSIKSTVNSQKMQMIQPEIQKIQDKYAGRDDENAKMQMSQEMMALYNKHNLNPMGSIGTMFLTFPIMIAMFYAAQRSDVVINGTFLGVSLKLTPWDGFANFKDNWPLVVIFLVMIALQFVSVMLPQYLAKKKKQSAKNYKAYADKAPATNSTNTMMISMVAMVAILGIRWPAAMSVYWGVSSLANVLKTLYIQKRYIDNE